MKRRDFLKGLGFVAAAPAIVKAENIMKIWVPDQNLDPFSVDFETQTIHYNGVKPISLIDLYRHTKEKWRKDDNARRYHHPLKMITQDFAQFSDNWSIDQKTIDSIRNGGFQMNNEYYMSLGVV